MFESGFLTQIRWSWELPVVQYHDFSTPSDYSAAIPIGNLRKMVGALRFEIKLTISSVIFEQSFVQHGSQPVNGNIPNRNLLPIAASLPPPPLPTPIPTYSSVTALMPGPRRSGRGRRYPMYWISWNYFKIEKKNHLSFNFYLLASYFCIEIWVLFYKWTLVLIKFKVLDLIKFL